MIHKILGNHEGLQKFLTVYDEVASDCRGGPLGLLGFGSNRSYKPAITSISTSASFGSRATCTVDLAGGADVKYLA